MLHVILGNANANTINNYYSGSLNPERIVRSVDQFSQG